MTASAKGEQLLPDIIADSRWNGFKEPAQALMGTGKQLMSVCV